MRLTVLAGGGGGSTFLRGLLKARTDAEITVVGNTADDITMFGLRVCPDLDTVMYTLGGGISAERGWGREEESFRVRDELATYGAEPSWFGLGDLDLATHLLRAQWLSEGQTLSEVTARLCERWQPGVRLLPATDDPVETHVTLVDGRTVHFQEWWVRLRGAVAAADIALPGGPAAQPAPGVVHAIQDADAVLLPPSNPVVSIGAILSVPAIGEAVRTTPAPVVGLSPIVGGAPVRGMADACLTAIGVETSAAAVAHHYGRRPDGLLDGWLVDDTDKAAADDLVADGWSARAVPLLMTDIDATTAMATAALELAADVRR